MQNPTADVYNQNCPSRIVLDIISNKWVILIIELLAQKPYRFGELKRKIGGISPKVLTQLLLKLEQRALINRYSYPGMQLKVEYSLTPIGSSLSNICNIITKWSENNIHSIVLPQHQTC